MNTRFFALAAALMACHLRADEIQGAAMRVDDALQQDYQAALALEAKYQRKPPPPLTGMADDAAFLRRACVDLAGRLPRPEEVRAFLADNTIGKRARLTDALVKEPGAAEVRFRMLAEALRVRDDAEMVKWLRQAAAEDRPLDEIIAWWVGGKHVQRRDAGNTLRSAVEVASAALGENLYCAMCHDHPYNDHVERETYEFAAFFAEPGEVKLPRDYLYADGKPGEVVTAHVLRTRRLNPMQRTDDLVKWLTSQPGFSTRAALRVWNAMFGPPRGYVNRMMGGVEEAPAWHEVHPKPLNNMPSSNCFAPPTTLGRIPYMDVLEESAALQAMAGEFRRGGLRLGAFQRILASTTAYSREAIDLDHRWMGAGFMVPAPQVRRLPSEVVWTVLSGEKAEQLPQVPPAGHPLRLLGRGTREWEDESCAPLSHELVRFMMNGENVSQTVQRAARTDDLFPCLLGREATPSEHAAIARADASPQDVAWALLNSKEFMFTR